MPVLMSGKDSATVLKEVKTAMHFQDVETRSREGEELQQPDQLQGEPHGRPYFIS